VAHLGALIEDPEALGAPPLGGLVIVEEV